jgi:threonine aldolase
MNVIDLRSDTVTHPTLAMREAMAKAEVGDDVYQDDPTTTELERQAASRLGKEAALFVPSGTMGNQLAIMCHTERGNELITGSNHHIIVHEVGAMGLLSQATVHPLHHPLDYLTPDAIEKAIRPDDIHAPKTALLSMENALSNGLVMPLHLMKENYQIAKKHGLKVHLDGARLFNATTHLQVDVKDITQYTDSVMFCLSKGLCAPIGSILAGDNSSIQKARKYRKLLGGGMRQTGVLAAAGLIALNEMTLRLEEDHANAKYLANALHATGEVDVNIDHVHINMVFFNFKNPSFNHKDFVSYLLNHHVKINPHDGSSYRFVTHYWINTQAIDRVLELIKAYVAT